MSEVRDPEVGALIEALSPSPFQQMLSAAWTHERTGEARAAAATYRAALQSIPQFLSPSARPILEHAQAVVKVNDAALEAFLDARLAATRARHHNQSLGRFDKAQEILLRKRRVYRSTPSFMYLPELPTIEFYPREPFPWLDALEAATADIRAEFLAVMAEGQAALEPYVSVDGVAQDRWRALNKSKRWGVFYLWKAGAPVAENLARCPKTAAALEAWPRCDLMETGPTAVFSVLDAHTRIPPHVGVNNARLIVHLPLVVPAGCGFRVGGSTREWEPGKAFVFDDTIEHEAWNDSDQPRAVLILDCWNPYLSEAERELVTELTAGVGEFYGELPDYARGAGA